MLKISNNLDPILSDSLFTEIYFSENGVFKFLTASFEDMEKWLI